MVMGLPTVSRSACSIAAATAFFIAASIPGAFADEATLKGMLKSMSDNLASQKDIAFEYDSTLDVVTDEGQIIGIARSGTVVIARPDHFKATSTGGFADVEMYYDGKAATVFAKNINAVVELPVSGTVDEALVELQDEYDFPAPSADLMSSDLFGVVMDGVTDVKGLGAGVIGGLTCNHLAFRSENTDWQIWMTQGDNPRPCRYVIASTDVQGEPRYTVDIRDWKTGSDVPETDFTYTNTTDADMVDISEVHKKAGALPPHFQSGDKE